MSYFVFSISVKNEKWKLDTNTDFELLMSFKM